MVVSGNAWQGRGCREAAKSANECMSEWWDLRSARCRGTQAVEEIPRGGGEADGARQEKAGG